MLCICARVVSTICSGQPSEKLRGVTSAYLFCIAASPLTDCKDPLGGPRGQRPSSVLLKVSQWPVTAPGASLLCLSSFDVLLGGARPRGTAKIAFIGSLIGAQDAKPRAREPWPAEGEPRLANISGTELTDSG